MDYRIHRKFSRQMFNINLVLTIVYLLSLIAIYLMLIRHYTERYYIETNTGFMIQVHNYPLGSSDRLIATQFFE